MVSISCYSVFGRKGKVGKSVVNLGCKIDSQATRKVDFECIDLAARDIALLNKMDENKVVQDTLIREDTTIKFPDQVTECSHLTSTSKEEPGSERDANTYEFVVDVEKLASFESCQGTPNIDRAKSCHEMPLWSLGSQGTSEIEVSVSAGEETVSSYGRIAVLPQDGVSFGAHEDASSVSSYGERSNMSSHAQGSHDGHSAGRAPGPLEFAIGKHYLNDGIPQVDADSKSEDVAEGLKYEDAAEREKCLDSSHLLNVRVCDDEERYSGHASSPGCYAREALEMSPVSACLDAKELTSLQFVDAEKHSAEATGDEMDKATYTSQGVSPDEPEASLSRVKEWIDSIELVMDSGFEDHAGNVTGGESFLAENAHINSSEASVTLCRTDLLSTSSLTNTVVQSLHPSSTVAHLSGIGLHEVPSLGIFNALRSLNLSANSIVHVPTGCLPRSLHSLDLSRNRIAQIEGFRELTKLRALNLSHNRITRISSLANCSLIKELYLVGNKIAEVEGLHRLLKLAVLDLSFNKITTSKALGQLAANYGSLLALNLLGNPILTNFSEDQIRKLVTALAPHIAFLNRQPIKAISVRDAALDSVARAALCTSQRHSKSRDINAGRKATGAVISSVKNKPPPYQHGILPGKVTSASSSGRHHHHRGKASAKAQVSGQLSSLGKSRNTTLDSGKWPMHRSRSASVLQE